jgi:hypothetical protein
MKPETFLTIPGRIRLVLIAIVFVIAAAVAPAETLFLLTFDEGQLDYSEGSGAEIRYYEIGRYVPGPDEVIAPVTDRILVKYFEPRRQTDVGRPLLQPSEEILPGSPQGGNALVLHSGRKSQGLLFDLSQAIPPGDLTLEWIAMFRDIEPEGNVYQLTYLGSNEWPFGGAFQWAIRRAPDQPLNFTVFKPGGGEIRIPVLEQPVAADRWYHFVGVLDFNESAPTASTLRFYVDGELQGERDYDASQDVWSLGGSNSIYEPAFALGYSLGQDANPYDSRGLSGAIDAFAISSDALVPGSFILAGSD